MDWIYQIAFFLVPLVVCGLVFGRTTERRHFRRIEERELANQGFMVTQLKSFPGSDPQGPTPAVVLSEVVIGSDYLKSWFAKWRNLFGGELKSLRTLQERAKREAVLRLIDQAGAQGFNAICNVRINGADIGGNTSGKKNKVPMAAVIATATGYVALPAGVQNPSTHQAG